MADLKVTVLGKPGSGKTTVARLIEKVLKEEGFTDVTVVDPDSKETITLGVIGAVKDRHILIETAQVRRNQEIK